MDDSVQSRVRWLISDQSGVKPESLRVETRIDADLHLAGDDVGELLDRFEEEFSVDMSGLRSRFAEFFVPESSGLGPAVVVFQWRERLDY